jgi:hypothetical protein
LTIRLDDSSFKENSYHPYDMAHFEGTAETVPATIFDSDPSENGETRPEPDQPKKKWWQI